MSFYDGFKLWFFIGAVYVVISFAFVEKGRFEKLKNDVISSAPFGPAVSAFIVTLAVALVILAGPYALAVKVGRLLGITK